MSEPTREQIKEAFKKTIERWEKIFEDVGYFGETTCELCHLPSKGCTSCPIFKHNVNNKNCEDTPFWQFTKNETPENAIAELNFLRKVYIWWMEGEKKGVKKEEKKEEWEDVTGECRVHLTENSGYYYFQVFYDGVEVLFNEDPSVSILDKHPWSNNLTFLTPYYDKPRDIKVEISRGCFRILNKI